MFVRLFLKTSQEEGSFGRGELQDRIAHPRQCLD
jgi:hypothetical protein